jgi:Tol biopolymer transport system component
MRWIAIGTASISCALILAGTALASFAGKNGAIVFQDGVTSGLYKIRPDGSHLKPLPGAFEPAWSGNGRLIAFVDGVGGGTSFSTEIFTMRGDGSHVHRVTHNHEFEREPSLSRNGRKIVYRRGGFQSGGAIVVARRNGKHPQTIATGDSPDWSKPVPGAAAGLIAFAHSPASFPCSSTELYSLPPSGGTPSLLPFGCDTSFQPSWRPNGKTLAFSSYAGVSPDGTDIFIGAADGSEASKQRLTDLPGYDEGAEWAPRGNRIVFSNEDNGLYTVNPAHPLVEKPIPHTAKLNASRPAWQPR